MSSPVAAQVFPPPPRAGTSWLVDLVPPVQLIGLKTAPSPHPALPLIPPFRGGSFRVGCDAWDGIESASIEPYVGPTGLACEVTHSSSAGQRVGGLSDWEGEDGITTGSVKYVPGVIPPFSLRHEGKTP